MRETGWMRTYLNILLMLLSSVGGPGPGHVALVTVGAILRHDEGVESECWLTKGLRLGKDVVLTLLKEVDRGEVAGSRKEGCRK